MIQVQLPSHLRTLAGVSGSLWLDLGPPFTLRSVLEALEQKYTVLGGAILDHHTRKRRPLIRFFICEQDWSYDGLDTTLPETVVAGVDPIIIIGAIAGG